MTVAAAANSWLRGRRSWLRSNVCVFWSLNHTDQIFPLETIKMLSRKRRPKRMRYFVHTHTHTPGHNTFNYITSFTPKKYIYSKLLLVFYTVGKVGIAELFIPAQNHSKWFIQTFYCFISNVYSHYLIRMILYANSNIIHCSTVTYMCALCTYAPSFHGYHMCWLVGCLLVSICHLSKWKIRPK